MLEIKSCWKSNHIGNQFILEIKSYWKSIPNHVGNQIMLEIKSYWKSIHIGNQIILEINSKSCWKSNHNLKCKTCLHEKLNTSKEVIRNRELFLA